MIHDPLITDNSSAPTSSGRSRGQGRNPRLPSMRSNVAGREPPTHGPPRQRRERDLDADYVGVGIFRTRQFEKIALSDLAEAVLLPLFPLTARRLLGARLSYEGIYAPLVPFSSDRLKLTKVAKASIRDIPIQSEHSPATIVCLAITS